MQDKERVLELKALKMYSDFIYLNRYRGRGLRAEEKATIVAVVIKSTREMYLEHAERLLLVFSQVKTKFDQYQRKTTAIERLLEVSGQGIDQKTSIVTARNKTQNKYILIDSYKEARWLRKNPLPRIKQCRNIQGTKTATGEFATSGTTAVLVVAKAKQDNKRKRLVSKELEETVLTNEQEEIDNLDTLGLSGTNTRRAGATPILSKRDSSTRKVSSTKLLGIQIKEAFKVIANTKLALERKLSEARDLMQQFYTSRIHQQACLRLFNKQPQQVAVYVEGNYKYRLRFIATIQSNYNTDDSFDRKVARINLLRDRRQKQLARIAKADAVGRKSYTVLIRRDIIKGIDLDVVRLHKIRLSNLDEENIDEEAERRSAAASDVLRIIE